MKINNEGLMPCVCGQIEKEIIENHCLDDMGRHKSFYYFVQCSKCRMSTCMEFYTAPEQASEAWNTMQSALQNKWVNDKPKEIGKYLFLEEETTDPMYIEINNDLKNDNLSASGDIIHTPLEDFDYIGLWQKISYILPTKE